MTIALVTGASGFVGSNLVDCLLERDYHVKVLVRRSSNLRWLEGRPVDRVEADLGKPLALPFCDVVFHVAGVIRGGSWGEFLEGNRDLSRRVFEGAHAARFVHVSSLAAAGPGEGLDETVPCAPVSLYGKSKWEGEQEVWRRRDRIPVTVIRPPVVYGPRDLGILDLYRLVGWGLSPRIGKGMLLSIVHVRDLVKGIALAAESPAAANEVFYMGHPRPETMAGILESIARAMGRRPLRVPVPDRVLRFLGAVTEDAAGFLGFSPMFGRDKAMEMTQRAWSCSSAKARRILGWEASVPLDRGMAETMEWYRAHDLL
jgi:nucleoside-diphosphate-sugar epimerase